MIIFLEKKSNFSLNINELSRRGSRNARHFEKFSLIPKLFHEISYILHHESKKMPSRFILKIPSTPFKILKNVVKESYRCDF